MQRVNFSYILLIVGLGWLASETVQAEDVPRREQPTWRFEFTNDAIFDTDNQFTNGFTVQKHSTVAASLDDLQGVRTFGKGLARRLLPQDSDLLYRKAWTFGQNFATPNDLDDPDIILDDSPYMGILAYEASWIAFNDTRFTGYALTIGVVGEYSFAEDVQKASHDLLSSATEPQGWEHQLSNEPIINFHYMKKRKLWNKPSFDGALNFDVAVGNFLTGIDVGLEMQFGRKPGGFSYVADPIGRNMAYDATLPRQDGRSEFYGSLTIRAWAWAVFLPLEGNTFVDDEWTDNNTIEPENLIGQAIVGFHYVRPKWGVHGTWTFATDNVDENSLPPGTIVENNFGSIMIEWRFGGD